MLNGLVVGSAIATTKHKSMLGQKLLVVQALQVDGRSPDGDPVLAIDSVGAGIGERVVITSDGKHTRETIGQTRTPVRWSVIGIRD